MNRIAALMLAVATGVVLFGSPLWAVWSLVIAVAAAWYLDPPAVRFQQIADRLNINIRRKVFILPLC